MSKTITSFFSFFTLITLSNAQITITSADMPNAGDSIKLSMTNSIGSADATLTGPNFTWDFSALTPNSSQFDKYDSPSTFPVPYNYIFNPTNTTYGKNNPQRTGTIAPGYSIDAAYDFFKETTVNFRQIGAAYTINGTPIPFMYSQFDTIYRFPMNYLNIDSCDYKYGLGVPTFGYYGQTGHRVNIVDGWGSITTPYGTFDALRVKSTVVSIDTVYYAAFSFGSNLPARTRNEYKWIATGLKVPLLQIDANVAGGTEVISNVAYIDSVSRVGISEIANQISLSVFPNPANDQIMLEYNLISNSAIKISINTILGNTIAMIADEKRFAGEQMTTIDVKALGLSAGVYFVNFECNGTRTIKKIIVQK
jgi:hypothetical protein